MYELEIPGEPVGKARPRVTRRGTYTPQKTKDYEAYIAQLYSKKHGQTLLSGSVIVEIDIFMKIPKSASKKNRLKMESDEIRPTKKPDIDNIIKCVMDGLNGVAYHDDKQVVGVVSRKFYSSDPRVQVKVERI